MTEGDLIFPPGQRREPAPFEPPPWEREQFEKLARREQEAKAQVAAPSQVAEPAPAVTADEDHAATTDEVPPAPEDRVLDEGEIDAMLEGLKAEEPRTEETYWKIALIVAALLVVLGAAVATWAAIGFVSGRSAGPPVVISGALLALGLGFFGAGVWLGIKTLQQQGVL